MGMTKLEDNIENALLLRIYNKQNFKKSMK